MTRPPHIDLAIDTLREVALTHKSTIVCGELLEVSHYVARLERQVARSRKPNRWQQFRAWWSERWRAGAAAGRRIRP